MLDISPRHMNYISINTLIKQKSRAAFGAKIDLYIPSDLSSLKENTERVYIPDLT